MILFVLFGCSEMTALKSSDSGAVQDTDAAETGNDVDSGEAGEPGWYAPRAIITITDAIPTLTQISISVVDVDLITELCRASLDSSLGNADTAPDETISVWLTLDVVPFDTPCATLPESLGIGIGAMNNDVRSQLGPSGLSDVADSLYAGYLRAPDLSTEDVGSFGYAGTTDDLAGDDVATLPPPDGEYVLNPLFLFQLPYDG